MVTQVQCAYIEKKTGLPERYDRSLHDVVKFVSKAVKEPEDVIYPLRKEDEIAFYDPLETNDSEVKVLGNDTLRTIARELVSTVRSNVTIDWTVRENVRAQMRVLVKRILRHWTSRRKLLKQC